MHVILKKGGSPLIPSKEVDLDKEVLRGYIDPIILCLLYDKDSYGYNLAKEAKELSNDKFELKEGTLYLAFKRLEKKGYVKSYWQEGNAARRRYYHITAEGKMQVEAKKREWQFIKQLMDNFYKGVE
ncbi:transcriptional regulator PadR-like family protein [Clostridium botulinum]|nr:transcriptional regulator PadR-like family protein [Clostridium botulinum CDC_297]AJE10332.1 transcriptional regulator PadR-like family protein [Clostridium botulinum CDC_1436]APR00481.1 transcriptional regulator PadR-like family protein [Clostridium botulinum]EPS47007.1 PadR family transcriptional regulator [Clostridium botulinum A1 str. CFSAN002368]APU59479.1 transcriptional regulator PadR-like family protein [Clostridium botulinum]